MCVCGCVCVCVRVCMYICMRVCMYACMYVCKTSYIIYTYSSSQFSYNAWLIVLNVGRFCGDSSQQLCISSTQYLAIRQSPKLGRNGSSSRLMTLRTISVKEEYTHIWKYTHFSYSHFVLINTVAYWSGNNTSGLGFGFDLLEIGGDISIPEYLYPFNSLFWVAKKLVNQCKMLPHIPCVHKNTVVYKLSQTIVMFNC